MILLVTWTDYYSLNPPWNCSRTSGNYVSHMSQLLLIFRTSLVCAHKTNSHSQRDLLQTIQSFRRVHCWLLRQIIYFYHFHFNNVWVVCRRISLIYHFRSTRDICTPNLRLIAEWRTPSRIIINLLKLIDSIRAVSVFFVTLATLKFYCKCGMHQYWTSTSHRLRLRICNLKVISIS